MPMEGECLALGSDRERHFGRDGEAGKVQASQAGTPAGWEGQRAELLTPEVAIYWHLPPQAGSVTQSVAVCVPRHVHRSCARQTCEGEHQPRRQGGNFPLNWQAG